MIGSGETWAVFFTSVSDTIELHVLSVFTLDNISVFAELEYYIVVKMLAVFWGNPVWVSWRLYFVTLADECIV